MCSQGESRPRWKTQSTRDRGEGERESSKNRRKRRVRESANTIVSYFPVQTVISGIFYSRIIFYPYERNTFPGSRGTRSVVLFIKSSHIKHTIRVRLKRKIWSEKIPNVTYFAVNRSRHPVRRSTGNNVRFTTRVWNREKTVRGPSRERKVTVIRRFRSGDPRRAIYLNVTVALRSRRRELTGTCIVRGSSR